MNEEGVGSEEDDFIELLRMKATKRMNRDEFEKHITEFVQSHRMCVLATSKDDAPRATPIEYRSKGLVFYMFGEPGVKIENIQANPRVSLAVFDQSFELTGAWLDAKGIQVSGVAQIITKEGHEREYREALEVLGISEATLEKLGREMRIIKVIPHRIELLEMGLKKQGYAPRQIWESTEQ